MKNYKNSNLITSIFLPVFLMTLFILPLLFTVLKRYFSFELIPTSIVNSLIMTGGILLNIFIYRQLLGKLKTLYINLLLFFTSAGLSLFGFIYILISHPLFFLYGIEVIVSYILIIFIIISSISFFTCGIYRYQKKVELESKLREEMERQMYSSKINPHFLFNSLNLMVSLLDDKDKAEDVLIRLSELLRYNLEASKKDKISINQELESVEKYLYIQKERFGKRLDYKVTSKSQNLIPPLLLQPLVENSIKHNLDSVNHILISIDVREIKSFLYITIKDSESKLKEDMIGKGTGLEVTRKRIELSKGTFNIKEGGIEICLPI